jgi:hypothetical protein
MRFDGKKNLQRRKDFESDGIADLEVDGGEDLPLPMDEYRKTATTFAVRMEEPFEVDTLEGLHTGKAGDWLAVGAAGELYPIDAAVFAATYEKVDD